MNSIKRARARLAKHGERGAGLVEYLFLTALIGVVCMVAVTFFGNANNSSMQKSADTLGGKTTAMVP